MAKRKAVESNTGPCPKRPEEHQKWNTGHLFQNPRNVPPFWCLYCGRLMIVPVVVPSAARPPGEEPTT